jgi:hypothetical protein
MSGEVDSQPKSGPVGERVVLLLKALLKEQNLSSNFKDEI